MTLSNGSLNRNAETDFAIQAKGLGYCYRKHWAVRSLNLQVPMGKIYGFLGLNGAGKSTAIRMLVSLLRRREGVVSVLGIDPDLDPVGVKTRVGYVGDTHHFYEWIHVKEIIADRKAHV